MSDKNDIIIEFDEGTRNYYIIWEPVVVALGRTRQKALDDLRQAAHFGVDTLIDLKLKDISFEEG